MKTQKADVNWCKFWRVSKNKTMEVQFTYWERHWNWWNIHCSCSRRQDHAGFKLEIELFGLYFHLWICDNRHWNIEKDDWEEVKEPKHEG